MLDMQLPGLLTNVSCYEVHELDVAAPGWCGAYMGIRLVVFKQIPDCSICGGSPIGSGCYHICPNSVHFYSPEQERADDAADWGRWDDHSERYAATAEPSQYEDDAADIFDGTATGWGYPPRVPAMQHDPDDIPF
jgi:hypothetical protein